MFTEISHVVIQDTWNGEDDQDRQDPGGQDRIGDRDAADLKEVGRLRIDAFLVRADEGRSQQEEGEKEAHLDAGKSLVNETALDGQPYDHPPPQSKPTRVGPLGKLIQRCGSA